MTAIPSGALPEPLLPPGRWTVDPDASSAGFRVRHLGFATVEGRFADLVGTVDDRHADGTVAVASIDTGNGVRDERLRSPEFFDAQRFPRIAFESDAPGGAVVAGRLTIGDVTGPVTFEVEPAGDDPGAPRLRARAVLSRRAFGLDWAGLREAGRLITSDRVELLLDLALVPAPRPPRSAA